MRRLLVGWVAVGAAWAFSLWSYSRLPARVATHWGLGGRVDGWSSKEFLVFFFPAFAVGLGLLLILLPRIDPRQREVSHNAPTYWTVSGAALVFLAGVQVMLVGYNLGWPIPIPTLVPIGVGLLFIVIGNLMPRMRPNWFMGIRTPWTLSNEVVWRKTHRVGGYCFVGAGLLLIASAFAAAPATFKWTMVAAIGLALLPVVYSYFVWRHEREGVTQSPVNRS